MANSAGSKPAELIAIKVSRQELGETAGSAAWLAAQPIELRFREMEEAGYLFRIAELQIADTSVSIAADGAYYHDQAGMWQPSPGIFEPPLPTTVESLPS